MSHGPTEDIEKFLFRHLHPQIKLGTASDPYAGWLGQIYSEEPYRSRLRRRTKVIGEQAFTETVLPVESMAEYFDHFPVLEVDFTPESYPCKVIGEQGDIPGAGARNRGENGPISSHEWFTMGKERIGASRL